MTTKFRVLDGAHDIPADLAQHEAHFGPIRGLHLEPAELKASGLTGRGGAGVATALKVDFLRQQKRAVGYVVVNAMEGEPAAHKDRTLISKNPHLILDGAMVLANMLGADDVVVCVAREHTSAVATMKAAIAERGRRRLQGPAFELMTPPGRYVAGEESALVHWLDDGEALPQYRSTRPSVLRIGRRGVLVDNAETHANVALIARHGADWFRSVGTSRQPGTLITTVSGHGRTTVVEVPYGTPIRDVLHAASVPFDPVAVLLGGYGGTWLAGDHLDRGCDNESLQGVGANIGAGVIVAVAPQGCGVAETARIVEYMARESARQCGPCAFGLPALAADLELLRRGHDGASALARLEERCGTIEGRGACRHPDGVIRLIRSALRTFADDVVRHAGGQPCSHAATSAVARIPHRSHPETLEWA